MKNIFVNCVLLLLTIHVSAQWAAIPSGTNINLRDVHFPTDSIGYIVGDYGLVLKSTGKGDTWQTVHLDSAICFNSVFFTNNDIGYAACGSLYKTIDGGVNWTVILTDSFNSIKEVYFVNDSLGFAGADNRVYKTTNAGIGWTTALNSSSDDREFSSIYFPSNSVGYFIGGPTSLDQLFKTVDGGQSFIPITNGFQSIKEATYFLNDSVGFLCGWYGATLVKTTDGGMSWQYLDTINWQSCFDVYFSDEK